MSLLPRGFTKGLLFGGVIAVLWGVLGNRRRRAIVAGPIVEKAEAIPIFGPRLYTFFAGRLMEGVYRAVAADVAAQARAGELLDLGAGPGYLATEIGKRNRDLFVTAMNRTPGMVAAAEGRVHHAGVGRQVKVARGDAMDIPYSAEFFDYVVTLGGPQHWRAPELALAEIHRVLKPGGVAWIYALRRELPPDGWERVRERVLPLLRPIFDITVAVPAERGMTEGQIAQLVSRTPFGKAELGSLEVEIAGLTVPGITKVTLRK